MRLLNCALALLLLSFSIALAAHEETAVRPIELADSVLAIYPEDWGRGSRERIPAIILAVWPDGHVVWSKDRVKGGEPYYTGEVDPEDVIGLLSRLEHDGLFADKKLSDPNFGPDSHFTTLLVKSGKKYLRMRSWHEVFEADGETVVSSHGVAGLNGQRRLEALRKEPADYLYYRFVWSETRGRLIDLIPNDGKPVSGKIVTTERGLFWCELPADARAATKTNK
jgi:hypothetical protein